MAIFTPEQIAEVQEKRGLSRKGAVQFLARQARKATAQPKDKAAKGPRKASKPAAEAKDQSHYYKGQRREFALLTPEFKAAMQKDLKARPDVKTCKHGHDLTNPKHVHVGDLMRTGKRTCNTCWAGSQAKYMKDDTIAAPKVGK